MKKVVLTIAFICTLITLVVLTIFGQRGFMHMIKLKEEYREIENKNEQLKGENAALKKEIDLLKNDLKYIEEIARNELGLIKDGETVYRLGKSKQ
jgi:cell division protein FtsB